VSWDDDTEPRISELRAYRPTDENQPRHTRRRPTRKWCKGKKGVEHTPAIRLDRYRESLLRYPRIDRAGHLQSNWPACGWMEWHWRRNKPWYYRCSHERYCSTCGKILTTRLQSTDCPDYRPRPRSAATTVIA
jgi:hypothetical protein